MNKAGFLFLGSMISLGSLAFIGCGDDSSTGGSGGSGGSGSSASSAASTSGSSASSSSGGAVAATCKSYCTANLATCTADNGQYKDQAQCEAACAGAAFPQGKPTDTMGNTLECR